MSQHRAGRRARARRQKKDYWNKMFSFVLLLAEQLSRACRVRKAALRAVVGSYVRDRLQEQSFAEKIFPRTPL